MFFLEFFFVDVSELQMSRSTRSLSSRVPQKKGIHGAGRRRSTATSVFLRFFLLGGSFTLELNNDRVVYTTSLLYLDEGTFFSHGQFVAADGGFEGDHKFFCSYKNPGNGHNKIIFNLAFSKCAEEQKTATKELVLGFHYLETTSINCPTKSIP